jgi:hypothetical protein
MSRTITTGEHASAQSEEFTMGAYCLVVALVVTVCVAAFTYAGAGMKAKVSAIAGSI